MIMAYPLFNISHTLSAIIPLVYYLLKKYPKVNNIITKFSPIFILIPIFSLIINYALCNPRYDNNLFKYRYLQDEYMSDIDALENYFKGKYDNVYFFVMESYLYKLTLDLPITEYDLTLKGNMGYNGEEKMIDKIKDLKKGSILVIYYEFPDTTNEMLKTQASKKIYDFITENYGSIGQFHKFKIYVKN